MHTICKNELKRWGAKNKEQVREKKKFFSKVDGVKENGRKYATLTILTGNNGKQNQGCILYEHYAVVEELGRFYLTQFVPENGKGLSISKNLYDEMANTDLLNNPAIVGTDGTAIMTGAYGGLHTKFIYFISRLLQW